MREQLARADLLPGEYAQYRPLLADGLRFFLERLPPARLRQIFTEQSRLSLSSSTEERLVALLHHVPALHKLGQVVARDRRLNVSFRRRLQQLESLEPRTSLSEVTQILDRECPGWRKARLKLGQAPLAEGSVAVVMPFVWRQRRPREGVFKLLKPDIQQWLEEDLEVLGHLGDFLDEDCQRYHLPLLDYRETFTTIRDLLMHEVRLDEEQEHLAEAARTYAAMPSVQIPALLPFCTAAMTAMERIQGKKISEKGNGTFDQVCERTIARVAVEALIAQPLFSVERRALFHADPHAGNLLVTPQGRVGILDWSLAGRLGKQHRIEVTQLLLGAVSLEQARMAEAVRNLALKPPAAEALQNVLEASLRDLRWGRLPGLTWLVELLDDLVWRAGVRFDGDLLLFRKSLLTLEGVVADVLGQDSVESLAVMNEAVAGAFVRQWSAEWPERLAAPLGTRAFGTHLSNADVVAFLCSVPATVARWWQGVWMDVAAGVSRS